ncbi:lyase family protein [Microbacterium sp. NPDC058389]|uniref:lyase family protein n=1 Tax=Microbacterium sp. NPDC058389 TaxID=3346475 RepID=UPI003657B781
MSIDDGLLSPVTVGHDDDVTDAAVLRALVETELALARAWARVGASDDETAHVIAAALAEGDAGGPAAIDPAAARQLAQAARAGGNPVIPLVAVLRQGVPAHVRPWVHRGATSQDILDTALMLTARRAGAHIVSSLRETEASLTQLAVDERDTVAATRTLTQHAVPTTVGARAAGWVRGLRRARLRLESQVAQLPAQLGGAAGTLAAFVETGGGDAATALPAAFAAELGLAAPEAPWHTERWPVTELGDALTQAVDALGVFAADVATLARTEIAELATGATGGSSAMPQKHNPTDAVLIRSAAVRAPHLAATLHAAAALAVDERPDGAWHAEWPALRELLRLALGAAAHGDALAAGLRVDRAAVARNLALTGAAIVSERLRAVLVPLIGPDRFADLLAAGDGTLDDRVRRLPEAAGLDLDDLLDPARYTGLAAGFADALDADEENA